MYFPWKTSFDWLDNCPINYVRQVIGMLRITNTKPRICQAINIDWKQMAMVCYDKTSPWKFYRFIGMQIKDPAEKKMRDAMRCVQKCVYKMRIDWSSTRARTIIAIVYKQWGKIYNQHKYNTNIGAFLYLSFSYKLIAAVIVYICYTFSCLYMCDDTKLVEQITLNNPNSHTKAPRRTERKK